MKTLCALWGVLDWRQRRQLLGLQAISVLMALSTVSGIAAILPFLTVLSQPGAFQQNHWLSILYAAFGFAGEREFVVALGLIFAGFVLLSSAINLLGLLAINRFSYRVGETFAVTLFREYLHRDYAFHAETNSAALTSKVLYETTRVAVGLLRGTLILVANLVTVVFILLSIVIVNPWIALLAIFGLGGCYALIYLLARSRLLHNGREESRGLAQRAQAANEGFATVKTVLLQQSQEFFVARLAQHSRAIATTGVNTFAISQAPRYALEFLTLCALVAVALYLSARGAGTGLWLAQLSFAGLAAYRLLPALQQIFVALVRIRADRSAFDSIAGDLRMAQERQHRCEPVSNAAWQGCPRRDIVVDRVSYWHRKDSAPAVAEVSLRIPAGSMAVFTGANGSGKTTLVDLLAGLLVPHAGGITIDSIPLSETNRRAWRSAVSYVAQETVLVDATFAENIAFGVSVADIDWQRLRQIVKLTQLEQYLSSLPNGFHERLGESGRRLSGGQRQRLGIARALYREAQMLILDEPASALDTDVERELMAVLQSLRGACTIVLITHRKEALAAGDQVFEFENGRVTLVKGLRRVGGVA